MSVTPPPSTSTLSRIASSRNKARLGETAQRMDRMYRYTRHIYDLTRRPYLVGRDRALNQFREKPPGDLLEVGCGTGRNLRWLSRRAPQHRLYGLDASRLMLYSAQQSLCRSTGDVTAELRQGLAQTVSLRQFDRNRPFDAVLCSYVLSMILEPKAVIHAALSVLKLGGRLVIVDFYDQRDWPRPARKLLQCWLRLFDVGHKPSLHATLNRLQSAGTITGTRVSIGGCYAFLATYSKTDTL